MNYAFLFAYHALHVTRRDRVKTYDYQNDPDVTETEKLLDSFIYDLGKSLPAWSIWLPITIRWIFSSAILSAAYVVATSHRVMVWEHLPSGELPFVKFVAFWFPIIGMAAPALLWYWTNIRLIQMARAVLGITDTDVEHYSNGKMKRMFVIWGFALAIFVATNYFAQ
ncbi:MAG: hypothetical protein ORN27_10220 [Rhodoluna sp.]|nr:hypothetical protein [Rhodoluna sp.]